MYEMQFKQSFFSVSRRTFGLSLGLERWKDGPWKGRWGWAEDREVKEWTNERMNDRDSAPFFSGKVIIIRPTLWQPRPGGPIAKLRLPFAADCHEWRERRNRESSCDDRRRPLFRIRTLLCWDWQGVKLVQVCDSYSMNGREGEHQRQWMWKPYA